MNHREIGAQESIELDAEAAEQALQNDGGESDDPEPFQPAPCFLHPKQNGQNKDAAADDVTRQVQFEKS